MIKSFRFLSAHFEVSIFQLGPVCDDRKFHLDFILFDENLNLNSLISRKQKSKKLPRAFFCVTSCAKQEDDDGKKSHWHENSGEIISWEFFRSLGSHVWVQRMAKKCAIAHDASACFMHQRWNKDRQTSDGKKKEKRKKTYKLS